ncbi:MAG: hypothetical protein QW628_11980 [Thermofilum sp.]
MLSEKVLIIAKVYTTSVRIPRVRIPCQKVDIEIVNNDEWVLRCGSLLTVDYVANSSVFANLKIPKGIYYAVEIGRNYIRFRRYDIPRKD